MRISTLIQATIVACLTLFLGVAFSSGPGASGTFRTGAPSAGGGTEGTCSGCHNTGAFGEPTVTWNIATTLGGTNISRYLPGETYFVTINVSAPMGSPAAYGFQSVFLETTGNTQAGTLSGFDANSQGSPGGGRTYAEHNKRTPSGTWNFQWTAPVAGTGDVRIYSVGNSVNSMSGNQGDNGSSMSTIVNLMEAALPVTLAGIEARAEKNDVLLNWETAEEDNVSHFEVERSTNNAETFVSIGRVAATGFTTSGEGYNFKDANAPNGEHFYRLRMVDFDETFTFSPVVSAKVERSDLALRLYPNPAIAEVNIDAPVLDGGRLRVLDMNGREVYSGAQQPTLDVSSFHSGVYLIEVQNGRERLVKTLVRQ
ncbi:choice-of-anchor V domain-containing protein [Neolewinella persica]|uniref:choice-of-anchor V domain-containing protein n=1 Tax=Neolewinella persica TaxID=70998 RepID=UPI000379B7EA|nr:choice-of-anchor V domain-containing protein [Neolewinella persica]